MTRTTKLMLLAAAVATFATGCASQHPSRAAQRFDCSPGRPVALGVGDLLGSQLAAFERPGLAVAPQIRAAREDTAFATVPTEE